MMEVVPGKQRSTLQKHTIFHNSFLWLRIIWKQLQGTAENEVFFER